MIADATLDAPARHGIGKLEEALRAKGLLVSEGSGQLNGSDFVIVAGLAAGRGRAADLLARRKGRSRAARKRSRSAGAQRTKGSRPLFWRAPTDLD